MVFLSAMVRALNLATAVREGAFYPLLMRGIELTSSLLCGVDEIQKLIKVQRENMGVDRDVG